ncbi:hypothetical protein pf16_54 [Pseudomonas phage pf16]|uniref:Uncharacterized protein n=1 Tax=Pseudomonas phage pf16 TaxID=1815630 RepID=A0A1S5R3J9_9CAUD|nr:hypothetical protein FDG98_gp053 [Pseudomonas phage pf16]AND74977.1 hypothetical protein pf16_54 [Pseudomonas phage pf16]
MKNKKVIDLSSPEGNVFWVLEYVVTTLQGHARESLEHARAIQRYVNLGSYDAILAEIEREHGDEVEFINK